MADNKKPADDARAKFLEALEKKKSNLKHLQKQIKSHGEKIAVIRKMITRAIDGETNTCHF